MDLGTRGVHPALHLNPRRSRRPSRVFPVWPRGHRNVAGPPYQRRCFGPRNVPTSKWVQIQPWGRWNPHPH
eukprot:4070114-Prymnesium_polylepis.1